jgi:cell division protein FtsW
MARRLPVYAGEDRAARKGGGGVDIPFLMLVLLLLAVGLCVLYSASSAQSMYDSGYRTSLIYFRKQALCGAIGLMAMVLLGRIHPAFWRRTAWWLYGLSIALLLLVLVAGQSINGAKRWINIAGIQFQPSELAKFTMIVLFARLTRSYGEAAKSFRFGVLGFGAALLGILIPLALEKHLSAILLMGLVAVVMMFVAGTRARWLLAGAAAAALTLMSVGFVVWAAAFAASSPLSSVSTSSFWVR